MNTIEDNTMFFRMYFTKYVKVTVMFNRPIKCNFKVYKFKFSNVWVFRCSLFSVFIKAGKEAVET
jgi:hypothetical protein